MEEEPVHVEEPVNVEEEVTHDHHEEPAHDNNEAVEEETIMEEAQEEAAPEEIHEGVQEEEVQQEEPEQFQEEAAPEEEEVAEATDAQETTEEEENTPNCPSRKHVVKCAGEYLDTNGNGLLERSELQGAIDQLPWLSRGILSILGSVDKMMAKCDADGDGAISIGYDMEHNAETCLATCFKRRAFKSAFFSDCTLP